MFACLVLSWTSKERVQSSKSRAERKETATSFRNPLPATNSCLKAWSRNQEILKFLFLDPIITMCSDVIMDNKVGLKSSIHLYLKAKLHNLHESLKQSFDLSEFEYQILGRPGFFLKLHNPYNLTAQLWRREGGRKKWGSLFDEIHANPATIKKWRRVCRNAPSNATTHCKSCWKLHMYIVHTVKSRVLTRVYNMEINFFPKGHSKFPLHRQSEKASMCQ